MGWGKNVLKIDYVISSPPNRKGTSAKVLF